MINVDLELAKSALGGHTIALCKNGETITSDSRGVKPMVELIDSGRSLDGYSVADKVVGKAAALLFVYAGIENVYAEVLSVLGAKVLEKHGIPYECGTVTERIVNRKGDGYCPMEIATTDIDDPAEALATVKAKLKEMNIM